ncbi:MAG: NAD-dependent epimerase/dehydratase family protein [Acidobacteriota bacterium]
MKVLVTGGTGFLGSHLADRYLDLGAEVVALGLAVRPEEQASAARLRTRGARVVAGSVADPDVVRAELAGVDLVFHLAVAMREAGTGDDYFRRVNVDGTRLLLQASRESGVHRFVYCSTVGVVGHRQGAVNDERAPFNPTDIYQRTKMEAEVLALAFGAEHGLPTTVVRPAEVYGPRDGRLLKLFSGIKKGVFPMLGPGTGKHHMIYVDDCIDLFQCAAENDAALGEVFIAAGGEAPSLDELLRLVADVAGTHPPRVRIPLGPVKWLAGLIEDICTPLKIQPPLYRRRVEFYEHDYEFDISKSRRVLGWTPGTTLRRGIEMTYRAYAEAGLL